MSFDSYTRHPGNITTSSRENVILVVSSSLEKAQGQLKQLNVEYGPMLRKSGKRSIDSLHPTIGTSIDA